MKAIRDNYFKIFTIYYVIVYIIGFLFKIRNVFIIGYIIELATRLVLKPKIEENIIFNILAMGSIILFMYFIRLP